MFIIDDLFIDPPGGPVRLAFPSASGRVGDCVDGGWDGGVDGGSDGGVDGGVNGGVGGGVDGNSGGRSIGAPVACKGPSSSTNSSDCMTYPARRVNARSTIRAQRRQHSPRADSAMQPSGQSNPEAHAIGQSHAPLRTSEETT